MSESYPNSRRFTRSGVRVQSSGWRIFQGTTGSDVTHLSGNGLQHTPLSRAAKSDASGAPNGDSDPDLTRWIAACPAALSEAVKADIVAMVQAHRKVLV